MIHVTVACKTTVFFVHHSSFTEILKQKKYKLLQFINKHENDFNHNHNLGVYSYVISLSTCIPQSCI